MLFQQNGKRLELLSDDYTFVIDSLARITKVARVKQPRASRIESHVKRKVGLDYCSNAVRALAQRGACKVRERTTGVAHDAEVIALPEPEARHVVIVQVICTAFRVITSADADIARAPWFTPVLAADKEGRVVDIHKHDQRQIRVHFATWWCPRHTTKRPES